MEKYFLFLFALLSLNCLSQTPTAGQLKVTVESLKCLNKSWDGLIEFDGPGSEVFINYGYRIYSPSTPTAARPGAGFTSVFGSNGNGRIKAGTASAIGGIDNGNEVPVNALILNEHVDADNIILISPSVWEWDNGNNGNLNMFNRQLADDLNWAMAQPYPFLNADISFDRPFTGRFISITDKYSSYWPITKYNFLKSLINVQENRPVGMKAGPLNGELFALYNPALLVLDTRVLITFFNHNRSVIENNSPNRSNILSGLTEMVFIEDTYAVTTSNGSYSLKIKIEFIPDQQTTSPTAPPTPKYTKQPVVNSFPTQPVNTIKGNKKSN